MSHSQSNAVLYELKKIQSNFPQEKISSSFLAQQFARKFYGDDLEIFESVFIILLNQSNMSIGYAKISQGGIASTIVDNRIIAHYAVNTLATGLIIVHNHPSNNCTPSLADEKMTERLSTMLAILDVSLHDSIIITANNHYSFADEGKLK
jgi:DNA repair protein RadC